MAFIVKLAILATLCITSQAQFSSYQPQYTPEEASSANEEVLTIPDYVQQSSQKLPTISVQLQLPKEGPPLPFYQEEDSNSYLNVPVQNAEQPQTGFFEYPVPSQDLKAPTQEAWNPNNDPNLYFEILKSEEPTNLFPKKFSKDLHTKSKPYSSKPKEEITLLPLTEKEFVYKKNKFDKTLLNLAKNANLKAVNAEKVTSEKVTKKNAKTVTKHVTSTNTNKKEPVAQATAFLSHGNLQELGPVSFQPSHISSASSLTSPDEGFAQVGHLHQGNDAERMVFQMHGHAGPHTYKWGYDTGKGHNRHFRFEERDKHGIVKGHYGFVDKHGKQHVVHYDSHPHEGFHAEGDFGKA